MILCLMELLPEIALIGRGRRPPTRPPTPTPPPRLLTESCGSSRNRCIRMSHGGPARGPPDPRSIALPREINDEAGGGAGRNRPRPKSEVSLWGGPLAPCWEGDWVQLRGWGAKRGVAMSHDILRQSGSLWHLCVCFTGPKPFVRAGAVRWPLVL